MNAHANEFVTLQQAAVALAALGDTVHPSNLSRFLDRCDAQGVAVPNEKRGKYRWVHLPSLRRARAASSGVSELASAHGATLFDMRAPLASGVEVELEPQVHGGALKRSHAPAEPASSALGDANLRIKQLSIREKELDQAEREGRLISAGNVQSLLSVVMQTFVAELDRQEAGFSLAHGREAAIDFRKARKAAQKAASDRLVTLAEQLLKGEATQAALAADQEPSATPETASDAPQ